MKIFSMLTLVAGVALSSQAFAIEPGVSVEAVNACNQEANQHMLKGADRDAYIANCTAPATIYAATSSGVIPNELQMGCEQGANSRALAGTDRDVYMSECTAYKNTQSLTVSALPVEKVNGCVGEANAKQLKGTDRKSFIHQCFAS